MTMVKPHRLGSALSLVAIAAVLGGCAMGHRSTQSASASSGDLSNIGLATRAQVALSAQNYAAAVDFAERAVAGKPTEASFRALLGNAYFASGRFASAETSYRDALELAPNQTDVLLKLVLVTIAQGRNAQALGLLQEGRGALDAGNYGLALALAGQPADAVDVLGQAARQPAAGARVRQNLALAYALSGDWDSARAVAAQDLSPDLVDGRVKEWMKFASPQRASDQVASLVGVTPAAVDPGQPVRLALRSGGDTRVAQAAAVAPAPVAAPAPQLAYNDVPPAYVPPVAELPKPIPFEAAPEPQPEFVAPATEVEAPAAKVSAPVRAASFVPKTAPVRAAAAAKPSGRSTAVVQLGAYGSSDRVQLAWNKLSSRFAMVRDYRPMSARFDGSKGTVYRLSIKGFASQDQAIGLCRDLKRAGGNCFVRTVAGDTPVRFASR